MFEKLIKEGIRLERCGKVCEALDIYKDAAEQFPERSLAWELLGDLHWNLRDFKTAAEYYRKARDREPDSLDPLEGLALSLAYSDQRDEAVLEMANYIKMDPNNPTIWYNYGVSLRRIGRALDAIQALERAKLLDLPDVRVDTLTAMGAAQLDAGMLDEAEVSLFSALSLEPQGVSIINNLGELRRLQGRWQEARTFFESSLSLDPNDTAVKEALSRLGD